MTREVTTAETTTEGSSALRRSPTSSIRFRLLVWFILLLALASATSVLVVRQILLNRLDQRIDRDLVQESKELRALAGGNDPRTGEPFGERVGAIFRTYLSRNYPSRNEALVTFLDGEPFLRSRRVVPYRIDKDPALAERWANLAEPQRGSADTPAGRLEYLAVPLHVDDSPRGVFVVAIFRDRESSETDTAIAGAAWTGAIVLLIGSLLAWRLASRILTPVRKVRQTALAIGESDLTRRIEVEGKDEISDLAQTFNQMLDRLQEAFDAQKEFIDDASHELRTPITIVRGHLETLGAEASSEEREETIALVMDELARMSRLVEDLLLLARSERPDFLNLTVVDVEELTQEVHRKAEAIAPRQWAVGPVAKGRIVADRQRLTQALLQLAQNASQHTTHGDAIGLSSAVRDDHATFSVTDSGPGIGARDQAAIFERFARGRTLKRIDGSGLGLSIVDAIARAHHGSVGVDSRPGEGATFHISIPIDQPQEELT